MEYSKKAKGEECKPLMEAATKDLFGKNSFRITGLPVDASVREISTHANRLAQMTEFGLGASANPTAFALKPPPDLDQLHEAHQNLKDPEKRLVDEFFWFWPEEFGQSRSDPAIQALQAGDGDTAFDIWSRKETNPKNGVVAMHNLALVWHLTALEWEGHTINAALDADRQVKLAGYWRNAFKRWEQLVLNDEFWEKVTARIRQINEPDRLPTGFARRMRAALPEALDKINAELAVCYAESGKIELARFHIRLMRETNQGLDNVEKTAELVLTPARNRLKEQIRRAKERADNNPHDAANAAHDFLEQTRRTLALFDLFFEKESDVRNELFDDVAAVCNRLQVVYHHATSDDTACLEILNTILPLATSVELKQAIEKDIRDTCKKLAYKKVELAYIFLKSIQDSKETPSAQYGAFCMEGITIINNAVARLSHDSDERNQLFDAVAIVLRGISLEAWNTHQDQTTAMVANEMAINYAQSEGDLKMRLREDWKTLRRASPSLPRNPATRRLAQAEEQQQKSPDKTGAGCLVAAAALVVFGIIVSCNSTNNSPSSPGNAYRVPSSASSSLSSEKAAIASERGTLQTLENQVETLAREIDRDRLSLNQSSQFAVDEFNAKVVRYNALAQNAKNANSAFNGMVDNYNTKLRLNGR